MKPDKVEDFTPVPMASFWWIVAFLIENLWNQKVSSFDALINLSSDVAYIPKELR